ncbi:MAG: dihydrodipicolinate synthase family protein [Alphaproteobacteria bacterium]
MNDSNPTAQPLFPRGLIAPNLTPFRSDYSIDTVRYIAHAEGLLAAGCVALAPFGTTGEALSVGIDERIATLEAMVKAGLDPRQLLPGTGLTNLAETVRLSSACLDLGCAGVMVLPPFYFKGVPDDGLFAYFAQFIEAMDRDELKICLYHIPPVAGVGIPPALVARLHAAFPDQIVAIKDSSGDWSNTEALLAIDGLTVYPGSELMVTEAMERGAPGCISALANINAPAISSIIDTYLNGRLAEARERQSAAAAFRKIVQGYAPINAQKRLLALATGDESWAIVRPPLMPLSQERGIELRDRLAVTAEPVA